MESTKLEKNLERLCGASQEQRLRAVSDLANESFYHKADLARCLKDAPVLTYTPRTIKTVALYYRNIVNGGAQRVVAQLCSLFADVKEEGREKYRVVLVTDEESSPDDYPLSPRVERVVIPRRERFPKEDFVLRAQAWADLLDRYQVDVVLHSMWLDPVAFWDMLCIKSHASHPAVVMHTHSACGVLYRLSGTEVEETFSSFAIVDGVVTLSRCDETYWNSINPRTCCILNPCHMEPAGPRRAARGNHLVWLGRISKEKQPLEMVRIMQHVVQQVPDAVCHMVGGGDEALMELLKQAIQDAGLENHVVLDGFHSDVERFYEDASVMVLTSEFEGFALTLYESAAYGLPTVTYDLPWLEYYSIMDGWASVPQLDAQGAAREIVGLLKDPQHWQTQSDGLYRSFEAYHRRDVLGQWQQLFASLEQGGVPEGETLDREYTILLQEIGHMHTLGMQMQRQRLEGKLNQTYAEKSELNRKLQKTYEEKAQRGVEIQRLRQEREQLRQQMQQMQQRVEQLSNPGLKGIARLSLGWIKGKLKK